MPCTWKHAQARNSPRGDAIGKILRPGSLHDVVLHGQGDGFSTTGHAQFAEDIADVEVGRRGTDDEPLGNRAIAQAELHEGQHFSLARAEVVTRRGGPRRLTYQRLRSFRRESWA